MWVQGFRYIFVLLLIILFVTFFGRQSLEKFLDGGTMFVESKIKVDYKSRDPDDHFFLVLRVGIHRNWCWCLQHSQERGRRMERYSRSSRKFGQSLQLFCRIAKLFHHSCRDCVSFDSLSLCMITLMP